MKKITIFAFIGFVFVAGIVLAPRAQAAEATVSNQEISAADAKILKQALDILGLVLKNVEAKISSGELSVEKKAEIQNSLVVIESSLSGVDYLVRNYAGTNYPGSGSLSLDSEEQSGVSVSETDKNNPSQKTALASLWATIWPGKFVGAILLAAAAAVVILNSRRKKQAVT